MNIPINKFATFPAGTFPAADWDANWLEVAALTNIYCSVSGTANSIVLTPTATSPAVTAYQDGGKYTFIAASSNTGPVTAAVGSLAALAVYNASGSQISAPTTISGTVYYELVYFSSLNSGAGGFVLLAPVSTGSGSAISYTSVTMATYNVLTSDFILLVNYSGTVTINAPASSTRSQPIIVKDYSGAAASNAITFVPNGVETIDTFSPSSAASNGLAVVNTDWGWRRFYPLSSGGWFNL